MPNMNGTGPRGQGSRTGRGLGKCANGSNHEVSQNYGLGRGPGRGFGFQRNADNNENKA